MDVRIILALFLTLTVASSCAFSSNDGAGSGATIDQGYREMYNLNFAAAHRTFHAWELKHPEDPLGPTSDAAGYLFSEFDRLGILQTELFTNDAKFKRAGPRTPDPKVKRLFDDALSRSNDLAARQLSSDPANSDALFSEVLNLGLRGDYLALIEKHEFQGLGYMKRAGILAEKLLAVDPSRYDAYLAIGIENYLLGLNPAPVRWVLRLYGAQTNKADGIAKLRLTAEQGRYLQPYARLLLAVADLRDKDTAHAKELLQGLASEFPNNTLYSRELARLP